MHTTPELAHEMLSGIGRATEACSVVCQAYASVGIIINAIAVYPADGGVAFDIICEKLDEKIAVIEAIEWEDFMYEHKQTIGEKGKTKLTFVRRKL